MSFDAANNLTVTRGVGLEQAMREFEQWFIWWSLERNAFNQSRTAAELKIHRNSLVNRIQEWGWAETVKDGHSGKRVVMGFGDGAKKAKSPEGGLPAGQAPASETEVIMNIFPQLKRTTLKRSTKRIKPKSAGITITKDGRTIRRGRYYTEFRKEMHESQSGMCRCGRETYLDYPPDCDNSFHVHHEDGRGGGKRDDTSEACTGLCGVCHRKEHGQ